MEGGVVGRSRCRKDGEDVGELEVVAGGGDDIKDGDEIGRAHV